MLLTLLCMQLVGKRDTRKSLGPRMTGFLIDGMLRFMTCTACLQSVRRNGLATGTRRVSCRRLRQTQDRNSALFFLGGFHFFCFSGRFWVLDPTDPPPFLFFLFCFFFRVYFEYVSGGRCLLRHLGTQTRTVLGHMDAIVTQKHIQQRSACLRSMRRRGFISAAQSASHWCLRQPRLAVDPRPPLFFSLPFFCVC